MPVSLKTQAERTAKTPIPACHARGGGLCGFQDTVERVPHRKPENRTLRRCAGALRERQAQKETACGRFSAEEEAASGEAGQSCGVVRAPRRSHLPAVRAVSGIYEGVPNTAKNSRRALRNEKSPPFQGKRRGSNEKYEVNTEKWLKEKKNLHSGSHRSVSSSSMTVMRTINARAAASTLKRQSYFIPASYTPKKQIVTFQKSCSKSYLERWIDLQSALDGSFSSWQLSRMSVIISLLRTRTLTPGAIRKCADLVWMKSKERMGELILKMRC